MSIENGKSKNFVEDLSATELAIITPDDSQTDNVVAIPGSMLRNGRVIHNDSLPFDVAVERYMVNSAAPRRPLPGVPNPATAGDGLLLVAAELRDQRRQHGSESGPRFRVCHLQE